MESETQPGIEAGITEVARELFAFAPQVLDLQRMLSSGYATVQAREHQRLMDKHGKDDPRAQAAAERIAMLKVESASLEEGVSKAAKYVEPLMLPGIFSG